MRLIYRKAIQVMAVTAWLAPMNGQAAVLFSDDFSADAENWGDRDTGEMAVSHAAGFGNNAGSMRGHFDADVSWDTDAWRLSTIPNGNDLTQGHTYTPTLFSFQFYADNVVPSDLILRFGNGFDTFFRGFTVSALDSWLSFSAPLTSVAGWFGGDQSAFDSVLQSTTFIELQVTRNGFDEQTYYFDNFQLQGNEGWQEGGGGGPSAVPEPNTITLLVFIILPIMAIRRMGGIRYVSHPASESSAGRESRP